MRRGGVIALMVVALCGVVRPAVSSDAEGEIRAALLQWTTDFNARDSSRICDLFAPDLRYDFRGLPERDYATLCALLKRALSDTTRKFTYAPDIKEIIVSGDLAVVRLAWMVTLASDGRTVETTEPGLDVFRRQPDGKWRIIRYIAYEAP
jgi:ketosteroid isomerase-like protein